MTSPPASPSPSPLPLPPRRRLHLLHYLLRSPLYDKRSLLTTILNATFNFGFVQLLDSIFSTLPPCRSRRIILSLLQFSQQNIPLAGAISRCIGVPTLS